MKQLLKCRALSVVLTIALLLGMLPADLLGGVAQVHASETVEDVSGNDSESISLFSNESISLLSAEEGTYVFDASTLDSTDVTDKAAVAEGTKWVDDYFEVVGTAMTYRVNDSIYAVETGKKETGNIQFTTASGATVTVVATSTGTSNTSDVALVDGSGNVVTEANGLTTVTGSGDSAKVTFTYEVSAGTYSVVSPTADHGGVNTGRGARIYSVTVEEKEGGNDSSEVVTYTDTYNFTDGSIIPSTATGKETVTYGKMVITPNQNAYTYNGTHGVQFKTSNTIAIKVYGDTTIELGKCSYSKGTVTLSKDGTAIGESLSLYNEKCAKDDNSLVASFAYEGESSESGYDLVLTFTDSSYVPFIKVRGEKPKADAEVVTYTDTYNFTDGSIVPSTATGKETVTYGKMVITPNQNAYTYNGTHGVQFKTSNTIAIKVYGDTTIELGKCSYSKGTVTLSKDGTAIGESLSLYNEKCAKDDNSLVASFAYEGESSESGYDLVLTFTDSSYVPFIKVTGEMPKPDVTDIEATVSIASGTNLLGSGNITMTNAADATDVHTVTSAGGTYTLKSNSTYKLTTDNADIAAQVNGKTTFTTAEEAMTVGIDVVSLVVNPTVKLATGSTLAAGKTISIQKGTDAATALTVGGTIKLVIGETYKVTVDDATVEARVGGATTFKATADMTELTVELVALANTVTMTVKGNGVSLGSDKIVMTNTKDATDKQEFGNGDQIQLQLNATYDISCTNKEVFAKIDGKTSYTVANAITALTVDISRAEYHTYDVWDFGAEALVSDDYNTYNNKLTVDIINSWYDSSITPGSSGQALPSFIVEDAAGNTELAYDNAGATNHRLRTKNTKLTRNDEKSYTDSDDSSIVYNGWVYSNSNNKPEVTLSIAVKAGDIVTFASTVNKAGTIYEWVNPSGVIEDTDTLDSGVKRLTYYAKEDGLYAYRASAQKLYVGRVYRERPATVTVNGTITAPAGADLSGANLVFTQIAEDGTQVQAIKVPVSGNTYTATLQELYSYEVTLEGANGYIIDTSKTADGGVFSIPSKAGNQTVDVEIISVDLVNVTGSLADLTAADVAKLELSFTADKVYIPELKVTEGTNNFTVALERGVTYTLTANGVEDYTLDTTTIVASADGTQNIKFTKKPVYDITVNMPGVSDASGVELTFARLAEPIDVEGTLDGYVYTFTGVNGVQLRDGQYKVSAVLNGYTQQATADLKVSGGAATITVNMKKSGAAGAVAYAETITVGSGKDYATINEALDAVRNMTREDGQRVTIMIDPGNYEEMLYVDVDDVTLKNAAGDASSIELTNKGVDIASNAVRITSYYGHGYSYYSMNENYMWDANTLAANKANGYRSVENPGSGSGTMWNATVRVYANGFQADGIIFENSFNQYVSKKAAEETIIKHGDAKEGSTPRADLAEGSTAVQEKAYVERAAALAIGNNYSNIVFDNCKFVGRQDTLYGGTNTYVEFNQCAVYGAVDYIFGGMIAIFNQCDLVFNTSEDKNDVGYITAAQQKSGRGYLMYECTVTSTVPGVDTASAYPSKPGYFGRPWQANTSEVVFYNTKIDAADEHWADKGKSLIAAVGWNSSLGGESTGMYEYGTVENSGVDNSASRAAWATTLSTPTLNDGTPITLDAFRKAAPVVGLYELDLSAGLKAGVTYDGGISVLEDMVMKSDGYIQGSNNPKTASGSGAKGEVPASGAVLVLNAEKDGFLKYEIKDGGKTTYFVDGTTGKFESYTQGSGRALKSFKVEAGHTYYLYAGGSKLCFYTITVDYREPNAWETIAAPTLGAPTVDKTAGTITVPFKAAVGGLNAEALEVRMLLNGEIADTISYVTESDEGTVTFTPEASGAYTFQGILRRSGAQGKNSNVTAAVDFILPMRDPVIVNVENQGSGAVKFSWQEVNEAEKYEVYIDGTLKETVTVPFARFNGLTVGKEYEFGVKAIGNGYSSAMSTMKQTITAEAQKSWLFAAFGSGVDTKNNKLNDGIDSKADTELALQSAGGKGKLVPASTDGLAFYYTTIDPETENFTLSADVTVEEWTYSNGQEGFGLMAADAVGTHGDSSVFWNNSYMNSVTKVEYFWDDSAKAVADSGTKYSMKLGVGSQEKIGVSKDNLEAIQGGDLSAFSSSMKTLDTSCAQNQLPAGTYNLAANYTNDTDLGDVNAKATFHLTIQRNNTGYLLSYTDENGVTTTNKYYHGDNGDELAKLDPYNIYVGFFASRNAKIKVSNVSLTTINPADDAPAEERPLTYITPNYTVESAKIANSSNYEFVYYGNADGLLTVKLEDEVLADKVAVKANEKYRIPTTLKKKNNTFEVTFTPDPNYCPSKYERLSSYEAKTFTVDVKFNEFNRNIIYVAPNGSASADGSKENPMDIYSAVRFVKAGDVILLKEGTYSLNSTVTVERGINGTAEQNIYMIVDPEATTRPVLDFNGACAGMVLAGDYWYFQGFDVTRSANGQKGVQVSGDYNTLDNLRTYRNGNTGIQISRYKGTDQWEDWPSNNLILNCTSYLNADAGYEDADGFAAKLTVADGNVFDGCIAAYNADDGWDLFAKIESGLIGQVKIQNSIAYKNGYTIDENGNEINAGNGNGFKMGGSSMSGRHLLYNSVAFANKSKGIDSNSCPDILAYSSTSFDNESFNVAFYTNDAKNTDFAADGVLSYKKSNTVAEQLKLKGLQDESKVYKASNYYFYGDVSKNTEGKTVADDWFVSLDTNKAIHGGITRNANGIINMNGYLELTANVPEGVGARMDGTPSKVIELPELIIKESEKDDDNSDMEEEDNDDDDKKEETTVVTPETGKKPSASTSKPNKNQNVEKKPVKVVINEDADWQEVNDTLKELIASSTGEKPVLEVELGEHYNLSTDILIALMGTNATLHIQQKNGIIWEINGKEVDTPTNINLKVKLDSNAIPAEALKLFEGAIDMQQFSLEHEGKFGCKAIMKFPAGKKHDGKFANLFYYNNGTFEFMGSSKVAGGYAEFEFTHASDYVVVITETAMEGVPGTKTEATDKAAADNAATQKSDSATDKNADVIGAGTAVAVEAAESGNMLPIILIILIAVAAIGGVVAYVVMRKKENE